MEKMILIRPIVTETSHSILQNLEEYLVYVWGFGGFCLEWSTGIYARLDGKKDQEAHPACTDF